MANVEQETHFLVQKYALLELKFRDDKCLTLNQVTGTDLSPIQPEW